MPSQSFRKPRLHAFQYYVRRATVRKENVIRSRFDSAGVAY